MQSCMMQIGAIKLLYPDNEDDKSSYLCCEGKHLSELMTPSAIFQAIQRSALRDHMSERSQNKGQSVSGWHSAAGLSGLGEKQPKAHQTRRRHQGEKQTPHTHNSARLKHAKNVVRLETSTHDRLTALTRRHHFHDWANPSHTHDRFLQWAWPAPLHCSR